MFCSYVQSHCVCACVCVWVVQSCPTLWDPMDCSLPGFYVHGILQARILEWVAMPFSSKVTIKQCKYFLLYRLSKHCHIIGKLTNINWKITFICNTLLLILSFYPNFNRLDKDLIAFKLQFEVILPWEKVVQRLTNHSPISQLIMLQNYFCLHPNPYLGFPDGSNGKNLPAVQEAWVWSLGWEDPLEKGMATNSSILAWRIPWREEPGRQATVHGAWKSQIKLSGLHFHFNAYLFFLQITMYTAVLSIFITLANFLSKHLILLIHFFWMMFSTILCNKQEGI